MKQRLFLLILFSFLISCQEESSSKKEKIIAQKIANYIIDKDSLNPERYSKEVFLHIAFKKLNDNSFKTFVSINGLRRSKAMGFKTEELTIKGFKTIIYHSSAQDNFKLAGPFWVPDSKYWNFLAEFQSEESILLNKTERIITMKESNTFINLDEIDF